MGFYLSSSFIVENDYTFWKYEKYESFIILICFTAECKKLLLNSNNILEYRSYVGKLIN